MTTEEAKKVFPEPQYSDADRAVIVDVYNVMIKHDYAGACVMCAKPEVTVEGSNKEFAGLVEAKSALVLQVSPEWTKFDNEFSMDAEKATAIQSFANVLDRTLRGVKVVELACRHKLGVLKKAFDVDVMAGKKIDEELKDLLDGE